MEKPNLCGSCRRCCQETLVRVRPSDIKRWKKEQRYDLILCIEKWVDNSAFLIHKKDKDECIFLTDQGCSIYEDRPEVCREFPKSQNQITKFKCLLDWKTHEPTKKIKK